MIYMQHQPNHFNFLGLLILDFALHIRYIQEYSAVRAGAAAATVDAAAAVAQRKTKVLALSICVLYSMGCEEHGQRGERAGMTVTKHKSNMSF